MTQKWYTTEELAEFFHKSPQTIRLWRKAGRIRGVPLIQPHGNKPAGDYRFSAAEIDRFMASLAEDAGEENRGEDNAE